MSPHVVIREYVFSFVTACREKFYFGIAHHKIRG